MELGEPDQSGRRRPVKKEGIPLEVPADSVISAVGETAGLGYLQGLTDTSRGVLPVGEDLRVPLQDATDRVFGGGDLIPTPRTVIHAVAEGKKAAIAMDCARKEQDIRKIFPKIAVGDKGSPSFSLYAGLEIEKPVNMDHKSVVRSDEINDYYFEEMSRVEMPPTPPQERIKTFHHYIETYGAGAAVKAAARCMHCGRCTACDNCLVFCPESSISVRGEHSVGYVFDYDYCKGCGICRTECPRSCIRMIPEEESIETCDERESRRIPRG
jgi:2-oxoacid:acceptor oxidoreductase delta subunit (pyruvate/2-ketoisovalerate family)